MSCRLTTLDTTKKTVSNKAVTFYLAKPNVTLQPTTDGHVIKGSLVVKGVNKTYAEGTDYAFNYMTNEFTATTNTTIANGTALSITYDYTTAEPVELVSEAAFQLKHKYPQRNGLTGGTPHTMDIVSCAYTGADRQTHAYGSTPGADSAYQEGVDYVVDYDTGRIARTATSRIPTFDESIGNLMYVAYSYCAIPDATSCIVTYEYTDSTLTKANYVDGYNDCVSIYGEPFDTTTGTLQSPVSVAAYLAALNGCGGFYVSAVSGTKTDTGMQYPMTAWRDAFDALTVVNGIDIVVPLSGDPAVLDMAKSHIKTMNSEQESRVVIAGADGTQAVVSPDTLVAMAAALSDEDVWMVAPSTFRMRNIITNETNVIAGYLFPARAGMIPV